MFQKQNNPINYQSQKSQLKSSQKIIQDQNYSNQIFYTLLSTLESILHCHKGNHQFNNKAFAYYDKVDYSSKSLLELKKQFQTQIFVFRASKMIFDQQNPNNNWQLPSNFDVETSKKYLKDVIKFLTQKQDEESYNMVLDIIDILGGSFESIRTENIKINVAYTESERKQHNKNLFVHGLSAGNEMDKVAESIKNVKDVNQLTAHIDPKHVDIIQQNSTTQPKINENLKEDIKDQKEIDDKCYFVLHEQQRQRNEKWPKTTKSFSHECYIYKDYQKLKKQWAQLLSRKYRYVIQVHESKKNLFQKIGQQIDILSQMNRLSIQKTIFILSEKIYNSSSSIFKKKSPFKQNQLMEKDQNAKIFYSEVQLYKQIEKGYKRSSKQQSGIKIYIFNGNIQQIYKIKYYWACDQKKRQKLGVFIDKKIMRSSIKL